MKIQKEILQNVLSLFSMGWSLVEAPPIFTYSDISKLYQNITKSRVT
jgi:hypothetical protein